ncbi:catalytic subunit of the vacuolar transporter chaperone 4 [Novymonas esmeraldas]|uniref:Catalytic subunit of the vacuolar transporter chaperone 4 n=1 Tax=Novymonas esmeraldas TaxID=1808958 RepID=A0AAW0FBX1_9TRYP
MTYKQVWCRAAFPDFLLNGAYVDYEEACKKLHELKKTPVKPSAPGELYSWLLDRKESVKRRCRKKKEELLEMARNLYQCSEDMRGPAEAAAMCGAITAGTMMRLRHDDVRRVADAIMYEVLRFVECRNLNTDTIGHIIEHMRNCPVLAATRGRWEDIRTMHSCDSISMDEVYYYLSRVYARVRRVEKWTPVKLGDRSTCAGGPQAFDRRSFKFWVAMQDLPFIIARVLPHLPLCTFTDTHKECAKRHIPFSIFSPVCSVYFDNSELLLYHRRLERAEGSALIRIRWYSRIYATDWNALRGYHDVYVEMKVHHEPTSDERSNKRRFAIKEKEVDAFLEAELGVPRTVEMLKHKSASAVDQAAFQSLATEVLSKIRGEDLKPVLRTQCGRAAFQHDDDESVRVSIDTNLRMSTDCGPDHRHWRCSGGGGDGSRVSRFPYAVVEVKLQGERNAPIDPWIVELMASRQMERVDKFSKYAHGVASLYRDSAFPITAVPYWMHQLDADIRASTKPEVYNDDHEPTTVAAAAATIAPFLPHSDYANIYQNIWRLVRTSPSGDAREQWSTRAFAIVALAAVKGQENLNRAALFTLFLAQPKEAVRLLMAGLAAGYRPVNQDSVDCRYKAYRRASFFPPQAYLVKAMCGSSEDAERAATQRAIDTTSGATSKRVQVPKKKERYCPFP